MEDLSHDSVNRFLLRERYEPKDLFDEVSPKINLIWFNSVSEKFWSGEGLSKKFQKRNKTILHYVYP